MIPYLSTFEQIQQEAQKLVNLKIKAYVTFWVPKSDLSDYK